MNKNILITGHNIILSRHLTELFISSGYNVIAAISDANDRKKTKGYKSVLWNTRSPLSAKNVVLEAVSSGERIDEAVVLFTSPKILNPFHEISAAEIERSIDYQIKSNLFLIKEILLHFQNTDSDSTLSIVSYQAGTDVLPPLEALASGGFTGFAKSLFAFYQNEKLAINAYQSQVPDIKEFSEYIYKSITERSKPVHGKLYKYPEKNVLSALGISKKH